MVAFFAPTALALYAIPLDRAAAADTDGATLLVLAGIVSVLIGATVPAALLLKSGLPPNTRVGLAIVAVAMLISQCVSITYVVVMRGTTL